MEPAPLMLVVQELVDEWFQPRRTIDQSREDTEDEVLCQDSVNRMGWSPMQNQWVGGSGKGVYIMIRMYM